MKLQKKTCLQHSHSVPKQQRLTKTVWPLGLTSVLHLLKLWCPIGPNTRKKKPTTHVHTCTDRHTLTPPQSDVLLVKSVRFHPITDFGKKKMCLVASKFPWVRWWGGGSTPWLNRWWKSSKVKPWPVEDCDTYYNFTGKCLPVCHFGNTFKQCQGFSFMSEHEPHQS